MSSSLKDDDPFIYQDYLIEKIEYVAFSLSDNVSQVNLVLEDCLGKLKFMKKIL